jgi:hypothetical protein
MGCLTELRAEQRELFSAIGASVPKAAQMHPPAALADELNSPL